jgi:hypothetical protein
MLTRQASGDFFSNFFPHCGAVSRSYLIVRIWLASRRALKLSAMKAKRPADEGGPAQRGRSTDTQCVSGFADLDAPF